MSNKNRCQTEKRKIETLSQIIVDKEFAMQIQIKETDNIRIEKKDAQEKLENFKELFYRADKVCRGEKEENEQLRDILTRYVKMCSKILAEDPVREYDHLLVEAETVLKIK